MWQKYRKRFWQRIKDTRYVSFTFWLECKTEIKSIACSSAFIIFVMVQISFYEPVGPHLIFPRHQITRLKSTLHHQISSLPVIYLRTWYIFMTDINDWLFHLFSPWGLFAFQLWTKLYTNFYLYDLQS